LRRHTATWPRTSRAETRTDFASFDKRIDSKSEPRANVGKQRAYDEAVDVAGSPAPPVVAVVRFIDCINRGDLAGLTNLMGEHHTLRVQAEEPLVGRDANAEAWSGYFAAFPNYLIYPRHIAVDGERVAVLGSTTGSHLSLPDDEELMLMVIWKATVRDGRLTEWRVIDDSVEARSELGLPL
jgi:ketosteroid isomerase-like protein